MVEKTIKAHCQNCKGERKCIVRAEYTKHWEDDEFAVWSNDTYSTLECAGCEEVFIQKKHVLSENVWQVDEHPDGTPIYVDGAEFEYYPSVLEREIPVWFEKIQDQTLRNLLKELYSALNNGSNILAAIAIRTVIDRTTELLGIKPTETFGNKINQLAAEGHIRDADKEMLSILIDAGSAAAHRAWRPQPEQVSLLVDFLESFLAQTVVPKPDLTGVIVPPKPRM